MLRTDLARDATFQARFRREAQSAASLNAPSVVAVYDTGEDKLDGVARPLHRHGVRRGPDAARTAAQRQRLLPEPRTSRSLTASLPPSTTATGTASSTATSSRRTSCSSTNGEVKVMDFGIARAVADSGATMTQTANVLAPRSTCRPSRRAARSSTPAPTSTPPAACSTSCSRGVRHSRASLRLRSPTSTSARTHSPVDAESRRRREPWTPSS